MAQRSSFGRTPVPVTSICGLLSSGKAPLGNVILSAPHQQCLVEVVLVQGVHQWFDMCLGDESELQESISVVIGRGLNREAMLQGWADGQITPEGSAYHVSEILRASDSGLPSDPLTLAAPHLPIYAELLCLCATGHCPTWRMARWEIDIEASSTMPSVGTNRI